MVITEQHTSE